MDSREEFEKMRSSKGPSTGQSSTSVLDEQISSSDDTSLPSSSPISAPPICRQFWKAGNYEAPSSKSMLKNSGSYLHINPKFLHSNATSHKWAFGAIAELLDNAIDEIENGATYVIVDKISNPRDGEPALLIQDDGGGMDPEGIRHCLSFGFSDKKSKSAIGHYGNGFKTSSMRLGADVIVFSRCSKERKLTQSVGLLSYTFLVQTGYERIVVPMVDYEFNANTGTLEILNGEDHFRTNLSLLLQWSPYSTEAEILEQFENMGCHGTKVVIYNLWFTDDGTMELDLDSDPEDIRLSGSAKVSDKNGSVSANEKHIAHQLRYSLRVYLSILYLKIPTTFAIHLRGKVVLYHNMGTDLKYPEFILYKPHTNGGQEGSIITTIGFLKEAPYVNVHGFNIYHKNRLILIMEWMEVRKINFSHQDLAVRLDLLGKASGIDTAEKYFNALGPLEKNMFTYGALLNCYCQEKMEEKALSLFKKMEEIGVVSTLAFNNLISLYMKLGQPEKVPGLVKEMRDRNIPIKVFTYNVLLHSYGCVGDIQGMERVYEEMTRENDDCCDWSTYSNLAVRYIKAGLHDKARLSLKKLEEMMGPRDRSAHCFLISLYANISDLDEVHRTWDLLKSDFPRLLNSDYHVILQALQKLRDVDGMRRVYSEWESSCSIFDVRLTNTAIKLYLENNLISEAESVFHEATKRSKGPFFKSWELFIEFFLRERNVSGAIKCLEEAISNVKDNEWKPNHEYVEKMLEYFEEERDVDGVEELCKMLKRINCLDSRVHLTMSRINIAAGKPVGDNSALRKRMEDDGIDINSELEDMLQSVCPK